MSSWRDIPVTQAWREKYLRDTKRSGLTNCKKEGSFEMPMYFAMFVIISRIIHYNSVKFG